MLQLVWPTLVLQAQGLPAFPGAEGFGANATGGRGGAVLDITTLDPDPAGVDPGSPAAAAPISGGSAPEIEPISVAQRVRRLSGV